MSTDLKLPEMCDFVVPHTIIFRPLFMLPRAITYGDSALGCSWKWVKDTTYEISLDLLVHRTSQFIKFLRQFQCTESQSKALISGVFDVVKNQCREAFTKKKPLQGGDIVVDVNRGTIKFHEGMRFLKIVYLNRVLFNVSKNYSDIEKCRVLLETTSKELSLSPLACLDPDLVKYIIKLNDVDFKDVEGWRKQDFKDEHLKDWIAEKRC